MTTLVIGARGAVGRHVLTQLIAAGEPVRASVRAVASADFPDQVPVVEADLTKPDTLKAALDDVRQVFLYATPEGADAFGEAALAAGVEHAVLMSSGSVLLPWATHNAISAEHRDVEQALTASGLRVTPIRPLVLANNALNWATSIRNGTVELVHPESVTAPIHERDIAAVAVAALTGRADGDVSGMLTGSELLSQRRQVELIGEAIGRELRVVEITEDQARDTFGRFEDPDVVAAILEFIAMGTQPGGSPATDTARKILGRDPVPFAEWAQEHAAEFT